MPPGSVPGVGYPLRALRSDCNRCEGFLLEGAGDQCHFEFGSGKLDNVERWGRGRGGAGNFAGLGGSWAAAARAGQVLDFSTKPAVPREIA